MRFLTLNFTSQSRQRCQHLSQKLLLSPTAVRRCGGPMWTTNSCMYCGVLAVHQVHCHGNMMSASPWRALRRNHPVDPVVVALQEAAARQQLHCGHRRRAQHTAGYCKMPWSGMPRRQRSTKRCGRSYTDSWLGMDPVPLFSGP